MEYISSIFEYSLRSFAMNESSTNKDTITHAEFSVISINGLSKLCLILSYERGFEIWNLSALSSPSLLLSVRNSGVKKGIYINTVPIGSLALISLYESLDFPRACFQVFSIVESRVSETVNTYKEIEDIVSNGIYIVCAIVDYSIEVFQEYQRVLVISPGGGVSAGFRVIVALSQEYLAYSLAVAQENSAGIANDIANIAGNSYNMLLSLIGTESLLAGSNSYNQVSILQLSSNLKLQEIHPFPVSTSKLSFSPSGNLLVVCPIHGQGFHVYRLNEEYQLIYKLHRGMSNAEIIDVNISHNESWVAVTSGKGTCHLYNIEKNTKIMVYNHIALKRIKHYGTISCFVMNEFPPAVVSISNRGTLKFQKLNSDKKVAKINRNIDFQGKSVDLSEWEDISENI